MDFIKAGLKFIVDFMNLCELRFHFGRAFFQITDILHGIIGYAGHTGDYICKLSGNFSDFPEFFLQGINSFADRGIVFNHVGVRVFYFINLTHGLDFFFNERFLFVNDKMAEKRHGCQTVFYFLFIGNLWNRCCGSCGFLFSKHKRFLLFKYHADHRLVYMLVIILFATADNAKVWSENCHVFCICRKISLFFVEQVPVDTVNG